MTVTGNDPVGAVALADSVIVALPDPVCVICDVIPVGRPDTLSVGALLVVPVVAILTTADVELPWRMLMGEGDNETVKSEAEAEGLKSISNTG